jgi:hypothetical protein
VNLLLWLGLALVVLWLAAWLVLKIAGLTVHLILLAAVGLIVYAVAKRTWRRVKPGGTRP